MRRVARLATPTPPIVKRELMAGNVRGAEVENFVRDAAVTPWHERCMAKIGRELMSVVNGS